MTCLVALALQTLKEAQFINKSLSFLEQTVTALSRRDPHVPFRQSRLTSVLRDALGGNCKVRQRAHLSLSLPLSLSC